MWSSNILYSVRCKSMIFHVQLAIDDESKNITAFNTPFGRYRYKRLPMGITPAPKLFQRTLGDIYAGVEGVESRCDEGTHTKLRETLQKAT
jgi:hypothetical protein